jgi:hypothetical protein
MRLSVEVLIVLCLFCGIFFISCSDEETSPNKNVDFEYGNSKSYQIDATTEYIQDEITGLTFWFPEGGSGEIVVSEISKGPETPYSGSGFSLEYSGNSELMVLVEYSPESAEYPQLYLWETPICIFDDDLGNADRWSAVPPDSYPNDEKIAYYLNQSSYEQEIETKRDVILATKKKNYWIGKLPDAKDLADTRLYMRWQIQDYRDLIISELSPTLRTKVENKNLEKDFDLILGKENCYKGFWWKTLFTSRARMFVPTIKLTIDGQSHAHETSHYLVHLMVGDNVQEALESQSSLFSSHGLGEIVGRNQVVEEYAYFLEYYLNSSVGGSSANLLDPYSIFLKSKRTPNNTDMPSVEGFGAVMLQMLKNDQTQIRNVADGKLIDVPTMDISNTRIFDIIAQGALNINDLRSNIIANLTADEQKKYQVLLHRSGWQYKVTGKIINKKGEPVKNAEVMAVVKVGGETYPAWSDLLVKTNDEGKFMAISGMFGGENIIQIKTSDGTVYEVNKSIDWYTKTSDDTNLGDITIDNQENDLMQFLKKMTGFNCSFYSQSDYDIIVQTDISGLKNGSEINTSIESNYKDSFSRNASFTNQQISWQGNSFSIIQVFEEGSGSNYEKMTYSVTGNLSDDGKIITSVTYSFHQILKSEKTGVSDDLVRVERDCKSSITYTNIEYDSQEYYSVSYLTNDLSKVKSGISSITFTEDYSVYKEFVKASLVTDNYTSTASLVRFDISKINDGTISANFIK